MADEIHINRDAAHIYASNLAAGKALSTDAAAVLEMMLAMSDGAGFGVPRLVAALDELRVKGLVKFQDTSRGALPPSVIFDAKLAMLEELDIRAAQSALGMTPEGMLSKLITGLGLSSRARELLTELGIQGLSGGLVSILPVHDEDLPILAELESHGLFATRDCSLLKLDMGRCYELASSVIGQDEEGGNG